MSSRRLQDVFARRLAIMFSRRLGRQKNVTLKTSEDVFKNSSVRLHQDECLLGLILVYLLIFLLVLIPAHSETIEPVKPSHVSISIMLPNNVQ